MDNDQEIINKNPLEGLDTFPDDINLKSCIEEIEKNQSCLIRRTRKEFTNKIRLAVKLCQRTVSLEYPESLWAENRVIIANELLDRFGVLRIKTGGEYKAISTAKEKLDIKKNIMEIIIEFYNKY